MLCIPMTVIKLIIVLSFLVPVAMQHMVTESSVISHAYMQHTQYACTHNIVHIQYVPNVTYITHVYIHVHKYVIHVHMYHIYLYQPR